MVSEDIYALAVQIASSLSFDPSQMHMAIDGITGEVQKVARFRHADILFVENCPIPPTLVRVYQIARFNSRDICHTTLPSW